MVSKYIIPKTRFAALCYIAFMQSGNGIMDKNSAYFTKKKRIFSWGYDAYLVIDRTAQNLVLLYLKKWDLDIPQPVKEYEEALERAMLKRLLGE